jgi:hypothetical protein
MTITNDLSNFGLMANAMYNSMTANATAITSLSVGTANSANLTTTTNVATIGTSVYFVANGNVGIGTSSPTGKLHIVGGSKTDGVGTFFYGGSGEGGEINFLNPDNTTIGLYVDVAGTNNPRIFSVANNMAMQIGQLGSGTTNGSISLHTSSAERVRIDASGNMGINQTSPTARLDVSGGIRALGGATYGTGVAGYSFSSGDTDGGMFSPADGTLVFATNNVERVRIDSNGNMGIGTNSPGSKLHVVGGDMQVSSFYISPTYYTYAYTGLPGGYQSYVRFYHTPGSEAGTQIFVGSTAFTFRNDGTAFAVNWYSYSDTRIKSDQSIIENSLYKIKQLNGITYRLNNSTKLDGSPIVDAGLIAQDVEKVLPQCVERSSTPPENDPDGQGLLSLNYNGVTALLVNAVKELNAKTDAALAAKDAEIEALKVRLDALEKKLN